MWIEFSDVVGIAIVLYVAVLAFNNRNLNCAVKRGVLASAVALIIVFILDILWYDVFYKATGPSSQTDFILNMITSLAFLMIPIVISTLYIVYGHNRKSVKYVFTLIGITILTVVDIVNIFYPILFYHEDMAMHHAPTALPIYILCFAVFVALLTDIILVKSFDYEDVFLVAFVIITILIGSIGAWFNYDFQTLWEGLAISYLLMYLAVSELYNKLDVVSELPNRNAYEKSIQHNKNGYNTILMMDMNELKKYNDSMGHVVGDQYIFATAQTLSEAFEGKGVIYRMGGDEFCLVSKEDEATIQNIVDELRQRGRCNSTYGDFPLDFAAGIATRNDGDTPDEVFSRADKKMYENKLKMKGTEGKGF